jgi:hypothetical protein
MASFADLMSAEARQRLLERLAELAGQVRDRFAATEFEAPGRPVASLPGIDTSAMLYDSRRGWLDQLAAYKAAKASRGEDAEGESQQALVGPRW